MAVPWLLTAVVVHVLAVNVVFCQYYYHFADPPPRPTKGMPLCVNNAYNELRYSTITVVSKEKLHVVNYS